MRNENSISIGQGLTIVQEQYSNINTNELILHIPYDNPSPETAISHYTVIDLKYGCTPAGADTNHNWHESIKVKPHATSAHVESVTGASADPSLWST